MKLILSALQKVQPYAGTPAASVYIDTVLHRIREFDKKSPDDPILEVLLAFYDSLAFDGLWTTYTTAQYKKAEQLLTRLSNQAIYPKQIEKAIARLDGLGFNTTPFSWSIEDEE